MADDGWQHIRLHDAVQHQCLKMLCARVEVMCANGYLVPDVRVIRRQEGAAA